MHGFLCSDGKMEAMVGMTCKKCNNNNVEIQTIDPNYMVWVEETEKIGNKVGNGERNKIHHKRSQRIRSRIKTKTTRTNIATRMQGQGRQEQDQLVSYKQVLTIKVDEGEEEEE